MLTCNSLGRYGRFGNQLFQIAGVIGIAKKMGYGYAFPEWLNYDHKERFGSSEEIDLQKYFINPLPKADTSQLKEYPVAWGFHDVMPPDNVSLSGHFQSDKYFLHCMPLIRHYFKMKDELEHNNYCAVHVRLGDYDDNYHPRLKIDYYLRAVNQFHKDTKFLVFSDDLAAASGMFIRIAEERGIDFAVSTGKDYIEDFRLMKTCKHFITGNSSYSLMAAILADQPDKKVVCPASWWGPGWGPNHKEMCKDVYPEWSIVV